LIAFLAMEIRVHAHARRVIMSLCTRVRALPIALGVPPQCLQRHAQAGWRLGFLD
jgi:hypothetical protein